MQTETFKSVLTSMGFIHLLMMVLFYFIWGEIMFNYINSASIEVFFFFGISIPIVLLISVLWFKSHWAYTAVLCICFLSVFIQLSGLIHNLDLYLHANQSDLIHQEIFPLNRIQGSIKQLTLTFLAVALLHNKQLRKLYRWKLPSFLTALLFASFFYLFAYWRGEAYSREVERRRVWTNDRSEHEVKRIAWC